ncbi:MAG TPA: VOC family protein [Alphaproteobacteria bacterium]|nr:VOC family protein [Alphaproteobacteria bacterium]
MAEMDVKPAVDVLGIDHIVLRARDAERLTRFYCDVLGCTVEKRQDKIGLIQLRAGSALIDIVGVDGELGRMGGAAPGREGRNLDHFALRIERLDADALRTHLARHGIDMGDVKSRYGAGGEGPSVYIEDPEGNVIELKGPAGPIAQE